MIIENTSGKLQEYTWYKEDCIMTARALADGNVRIDLKNTIDCLHGEVFVVIGFDEFSLVGSRRMWTDELINTSMGRRE